ncbi:MAG: DNA integrity scanning protein DisA nucleotide-binding domain protein [Candidatus Pacearchaeota archaeon]
MKKRDLKEIEQRILKIAIEIAKESQGALFVIGDNIKYERLLKQKLKSFNIFEKGAEKILKGLAVIDGALIIDKRGDVKDYGVLIKETKPFIGFGTRHAAAVSASKNNNLAILVSEEERKVKIFQNGRYIMQIDPFQKNIEKRIPFISKILEAAGAGVIGTIGTVVIAPTLGIALIPGIILFGGSYFAIKSFLEKNKKFY